jgi:hypothetical protein
MRFVESNTKEISDFQANFCVMGSGDIDRAIDVAKETDILKTMGYSGYIPDALYERLEDYADELGYKDRINDIDIVAILYEDILQNARNDIEKKTKYDFINDFSGRGEIYVAGNFLATNYDYTEEAKEELQQILIDNNVKINNFSKATQWFLDEIEIDLK